MHAAALILFSLCVQFLSPAFAQEEHTGSGNVLPAADMQDPPANATGTVLPVTGSGLSVHPESSETPVPVVHQPRPSGLLVRINELLWAGSDLSTADEWIELTAVPVLTGSTLTEAVSLDGWSILSVKGEVETEMIRLNATHVIGSGGLLVIANNAANSSRLRFEPSLVTSAVSLPNTQLLLRLRDASGALIDEVDDGVGAPFAGANPSGGTKASMERIDPRLPGTLKENWRTADTRRGLDANALVLGTPGFANGTVELPDTDPPANVLRPRAWSTSGAIFALWTPSHSADAAQIVVDLRSATAQTLTRLSLPASSTGVILELDGASGASLVIHVIDESHNQSGEESIYVQPLNKPIINELMPNPQGADTAEWIELHNPFDAPLDLGGWSLRSGSRHYVFPNGTGSIIPPSDTRLVPAQVIGLALPNAGGELDLSIRGRTIDRIVYPEMPEGIAYGRSRGMDMPICMPTPGSADEPSPPTVEIGGIVSQGSEPLTLNLNAVASGGTLAGARCRWDFGDGFSSDRCNPPAHRMRANGDLQIALEVVDYCGNTLSHSERVLVLQQQTSTKNVGEKNKTCTPRASTGILITEFLPSPEQGAEGEWIELHHTGGHSVDLCAWSIDDREGGSRPYSLAGHRISSGQYLVLTRKETRIALNNDQDMVRLVGPLPDGTGTGVLQSVAYQQAKAGQSRAVRADDQWLWTPYATPGSSNRFEEVDMTGFMPVVTLFSALPNPKGDDRYGEWIELRNETMRPQWLNGWTLRTESGASLQLDGYVIARKKTLRINLEKTSLKLRNGIETILLTDPNGQPRSALSWKGAKEGQAILQPALRQAGFMHDVSVLSPVRLRGRFGMGTGVPDESKKLPLQTIELPGVQSPYDSFIKYNAINLISALIKDKNIELKNDSNSTAQYAFVNGTDLASILLRSGLMYVQGGETFARALEYEAYEREARRQLRGLWADGQTASMVDQRKAAEAMDAMVRREGITLTIEPPSGLVASGTVLRASPSIDAELFMRYGTGEVHSFSGSVIIQPGRYELFAEYRPKSDSGAIIRSPVTIREYDIFKPRYPRCVRIQEVYPSPRSGEAEWVELVNECSDALRLWGWSIDDESGKGSKPSVFGSGVWIQGKSHLILSGALLPITLNNGGDLVHLVDPTGRVTETIRYPSIKKGHVYALVGQEWCVSEQASPGGPNGCVLTKTKKKSSGKSAANAAASIGLGTKYSSMAPGSGTDENTKRERNFYFYEGLNRNNTENSIPLLVLSYLCILALVIVILLMRMRG